MRKQRKPIPVNLSHVEKDVENALISRGSGSGRSEFFSGCFDWLRVCQGRPNKYEGKRIACVEESCVRPGFAGRCM